MKPLILVILAGLLTEAAAYPIDGYTLTGIRRLLRLELILKGEMTGTKPIPGA